jgi:hypothetical protein
MERAEVSLRKTGQDNVDKRSIVRYTDADER